jgi:prepilin-type N-terminal cleavage/methylation domain-containing protein
MISPRLRAARRRRAFTLIELIVGLAVSTLILGAAAGVFVTTMQSWERGSNTRRMLQAAQTTGDLVEKHLRSAVAPSSGVNVIFWGFDLSNGEQHGHWLTLISTAP